jgi:hypothetical protein
MDVYFQGIKLIGQLSGRVRVQSSRELWVCEFMVSGISFNSLELISRTAIGLRVKDGVVLAIEKLVQSKLLIPGKNRRIQSVDRHIGLVSFHSFVSLTAITSQHDSLTCVFRPAQGSSQMVVILPLAHSTKP